MDGILPIACRHFAASGRAPRKLWATEEPQSPSDPKKKAMTELEEFRRTMPDTEDELQHLEMLEEHARNLNKHTLRKARKDKLEYDVAFFLRMEKAAELELEAGQAA